MNGTKVEAINNMAKLFAVYLVIMAHAFMVHATLSQDMMGWLVYGVLLGSAYLTVIHDEIRAIRAWIEHEKQNMTDIDIADRAN